MPDAIQPTLLEETYNAGRIRISRKLLMKMFGLPDGWVLRGVSPVDFGRGFDLFIEGEGLPQVTEGCELPDVPLVSVTHVEPDYEDEDGYVYYRTEIEVQGGHRLTFGHQRHRERNGGHKAALS